MITDDILKLRQQAIELYRIKREQEALELFERAAECGDYLSNVYIARYMLSKCKYGEAEMSVDRVIDAYKSAPQPVEDTLLIEAAAEAYYILGEMDDDNFAAELAESHWNEAASLGCVKAYYRLGYLLYNSGDNRLEEALEYWKMGAEAGDDNCIAPYNEHLNEDTEEPIYEGETDENGLPHGEGVMYYPKTELKEWCGFKVAPKCYEGQWCHGVKSGKGKMLYFAEDMWSSVSYTGDWKNDMPEGTGRLCECFIDVKKQTLEETYRYEGDWVAGSREGFGVETLKDKRTIMCYWVSDIKQGGGLIQTPDGRSFRGVWEKGGLDKSSCYLEGEPSLNITVSHSGLDYYRTAMYLIPCKRGSYQFADGVELMSHPGFKDSESLIDILGVEDGVVRYSVGEAYSDNNEPIEGTIAVEQSVQHRSAVEATATIYGDDHDYEIVREIEIKYNK